MSEQAPPPSDPERPPLVIRRVEPQEPIPAASDLPATPESDPDPQEGAVARPGLPRRSRPVQSPPGLIIAAAGGALLAFSPLLPWWKEEFRLTALNASVPVRSIGALRAWPGMVTLAAGLVVLLAGIAASARPRLRSALGSVVLAAGALGSLSALYAALGRSAPHVPAPNSVVVSPIAYIAVAGGVLCGLGGYLLTREAEGGIEERR